MSKLSNTVDVTGNILSNSLAVLQKEKDRTYRELADLHNNKGTEERYRSPTYYIDQLSDLEMKIATLEEMRGTYNKAVCRDFYGQEVAMSQMIRDLVGVRQMIGYLLECQRYSHRLSPAVRQKNEVELKLLQSREMEAKIQKWIHEMNSTVKVEMELSRNLSQSDFIHTDEE